MNNKMPTVPDQDKIHKDFLSEKFKAWASARPEAIAFSVGENSFTYNSLDGYSAVVCQGLIRKGIGSGDVVALHMSRSAELIISIFGVLKAGACFIVIDPAYPEARIKDMLLNCEAKIVIIAEGLIPGYLRSTVSTVTYSDCIAGSEGENGGAAVMQVDENATAYIIYTSGSTGVPKGVAITYANLGYYIQAMTRRIGINKDDTYLHTASFSFSSSIRQLMLPLFNGARLVVAMPEEIQNPLLLLNLIKNEEVTVVDLIPSYFRSCIDVLAQLSDSDRNDLSDNSLRLVLSASEALTTEVTERWMFKLKNNAIIINMYGQTETTGIVSTYRVPFEYTGENKIVSIGKAIDGTRIDILDAELNACEEGEIYISGGGVGNGYVQDPDLTARNFIRHSFDGEEKIMYRTGDIGRRLADGNIQYTGRLGNQVKISGFRIAPEEIEAALKLDYNIRECVVRAQQVGDGDALVAYYSVRKEKIASGALRDRLMAKLPPYMVPAFFMEVEDFEHTASGKIDRDKLPALEIEGLKQSDAQQPVTELERTIQKIWEEVLRISPIGTGVHFFKEIGGSSLKAIQIVARIYKQLNVLIKVGDIFSYQTIKELAAFIEGLKQDAATAIPLLGEKPYYNLSSPQMRAWLTCQIKENPAPYNIDCTWEVVGVLNFTALQDAFREIIRRHDSLRMNFLLVDGVPKIKIHQNGEAAFTITDHYIDLRGKDITEAEQLIRNETQKVFDLEHDPLFSLKIIQLKDEEYILSFVVHHIISDAWSMEIIFREFGQLYNSYCSRSPLALPEQPVRFVDFAEWQLETMQGAAAGGHLDYWKNKLRSAGVLQFTPDYEDGNRNDDSARIYSFEIDAYTTGALVRLSKELDTTLFSLLFTAYYVFLTKYTGSSDIVIGTPIANRNRKELESVVGFFLNSLAIRITSDGTTTIRQLIGQVKQTILEAYEHQDVPFEKIVQELQPERSLSHSPIFQTLFVLNNTPYEAIDLHEVKLYPRLATGDVSTNFDLAFSLVEKDDSITGKIEYKTGIFKAETILLMSARFEKLLELLLQNPDARLDGIDLKMGFEKANKLLAFMEQGENF